MNTTDKLVVGDLLVQFPGPSHRRVLLLLKVCKRFFEPERISDLLWIGWKISILGEVKKKMTVVNGFITHETLKKSFIIFRKGQKLRYEND